MNQIAVALIAVLLVSMLVFAVRSRDRLRDAGISRHPKTLLIGDWTRTWLYWLITPIERLFLRARVSPDVFNFLGVVFGIGAGIGFAYGAAPLAGWAVLLGAACDVFDGRIARARQLVSSYGAFLDSTLDRFAETLTYMGLVWHVSPSRSATALTTLALSGSLLVSYTRARGEALGVTSIGGVFQRAERLVLLATAAILDGPLTSFFGWPPQAVLLGACGAIGVGSFGTAIYRGVVIARVLRRDGSEAARDGDGVARGRQNHSNDTLGAAAPAALRARLVRREAESGVRTGGRFGEPRSPHE